MSEVEGCSANLVASGAGLLCLLGGACGSQGLFEGCSDWGRLEGWGRLGSRGALKDLNLGATRTRSEGSWGSQ